MSPSNNLLLHLHKLIIRQDENFFTESLAHLLCRLLVHEPAVACRLLHELSGKRLQLTIEEAEFVTLTTQVTTDEGRPDIEIRLPDHLIYIEVKVESGLGEGQLEHYREALKKSGVEYQTLILLSQYHVELSNANLLDASLRWYEVADWLEHELEKVEEPINRYLVEQFLEFLQERGIAMEQVGWELERGTQAFRSLLGMMGKALAVSKRAYQRRVAWDWMGYSIETNQFYFYIYYERPSIVVFRTYSHPVDKVLAKKTGVGRVWEENPVGVRWENTLDLASEEVHFFARSKGGQLQIIQDFLLESLATSERIKAAQAAPIILPPEGEETDLA